MESKILELILKVRQVAPSLEGLDFSEVLELANDALEEYIEDIQAGIEVRQATAISQDSIIMAVSSLTNIDLDTQMSLIGECQSAKKSLEKSIIMYEELKNECQKFVR